MNLDNINFIIDGKEYNGNEFNNLNRCNQFIIIRIIEDKDLQNKKLSFIIDNNVIHKAIVRKD